MKSDLVVLGGGLAGAASCLSLRRLGFHPLWIVGPEKAGAKPGEHLSPSARPLLAQLEAAHLLDKPYHREAHSLLSAWGSESLLERNSILHLEGPGLALDRVRFERDIRDLALSRGVQVLHGSVESVQESEQGWRFQRGDEEIVATFVFDATGRRALVARSVSQSFRADRLVALYGFYSQETGAVEPSSVTLLEAVEQGWWYATLLADKTLALFYYTDPDLLPPGASKESDVFLQLLQKTVHIERWCREASFALHSPPKLASAGTHWQAPCAGKSWIAVGDAAAAFDPLSSHGMTTALWTGIQAAQAYLAQMKGEDQSLPAYALKVAQGLQNYLLSRAEIYGRETRFSESEFWGRRHPGRGKLSLVLT